MGDETVPSLGGGQNVGLRSPALTRLLIFTIGILGVIALAVAFAVVWRDRSAGTIHYRGRDYIHPETMSAADADRWRPLSDTHTTRLGMELFVPARETRGGLVPTIVFLGRGDGSFRTYELSGGP